MVKKNIFWIFIVFIFLIQDHAALAQTPAPKDCSKTSISTATGLVKPLTDMRATEYYPNITDPFRQDGGLYGQGINILPLTHPHMQKAIAATSQIVPRNAAGDPDPNGKIGFISLGMSNTKYEFDHFKSYPAVIQKKSPQVVLVNGAWQSMVAQRWSGREITCGVPPPSGGVGGVTDPWQNFNDKITQAGLTKAQIQAVWMKLTNAYPQSCNNNDFADFVNKMYEDMRMIMERLNRPDPANPSVKEYPNLKVIYVSSRIYGGYSQDPLSPEHSAYWSGFAMRKLIQDQMIGDNSGITYDYPILLWGYNGPNATTYLWANGVIPRSDGLTYQCSDLVTDGVHPADGAKIKVTNMLLNFFISDPLAKVWFTGSGVLPSATPLPSIAPSPASAYFQFDIPPHPETFVFQLNDPIKIQQARDMLNQVMPMQSVMGKVIKQSQSYNPPWSFHLDPNSVTFFRSATEVCDAHIQYVENNLAQVCTTILPNCVWCPWNSRLIAEVYPGQASVSPAPSGSPSYKKGDVNHDGIIDQLDLALILTNFSRQPTQVPNYFDPVSDSKINLWDAGWVIKYW